MSQTNMPSPDSPQNTKMNLSGHHPTLPTSTINHDPYGHPDPKPRITPSHYATVSDSILGYANKAHDMVLGPTGDNNKTNSVSTEDHAREMIGTGIPNYSRSSLLNTPLKTTTTTTTTLTTGLDRTMTHSPTLYDKIATDNPALAFGEPEDEMATYEVQKYRKTHPWITNKKNSYPMDTHLMEMIADVRVNNGGFDEAEDAMSMYEASKYHSLDHTVESPKIIDKPNETNKNKRVTQMVDPSWINVE